MTSNRISVTLNKAQRMTSTFSNTVSSSGHLVSHVYQILYLGINSSWDIHCSSMFLYEVYCIYSAIRRGFPSLEWVQIIKSVLCNFAVIRVLPFPNNAKDLDLSYKMDLDFWDCFGREKTPSYKQRNTVVPKLTLPLNMSRSLKVIIWTHYDRLDFPLLHTKFQDHWPFRTHGSWEKDFWSVFTYIGILAILVI